MARERIRAGMPFAGGILTEKGAQEVKTHRLYVRLQEKKSVIDKILDSGNVEPGAVKKLIRLKKIKPY